MLANIVPTVLATVVTAVLATTVSLVSPTHAQARTSCVPPPVAHRGASASAPENTRPAFRKALRGGVRILEMDVQFTSDGVPVVIHDATVDRTTNGSGLVAALDLASLRGLDAGAWFAKAYRDTRVPTLSEVLADASRARARSFVELKVRPTPPQLQRLLAVFAMPGVSSRITVTSFDADALADVRAAAPRLRTALIDPPQPRDAASVVASGRAYLPYYRSVTATGARQWRAQGVALFPWGVHGKRDWSRLAAYRVGGTITNAPVSYLRWARTRCS